MKVDMDPHSITMRIKKTSELRRLCFALGGERIKKKLQAKQIQTSHSAVQKHTSAESSQDVKVDKV
jgi:hypothetical protein